MKNSHFSSLKLYLSILLLILCHVAHPGSTKANPGVVDLSFGNLGFVATDIGGENDRGNGIAIQDDGKIVVAGTAFVAGDNDFAVARYHPDGILDSSFNPLAMTPGIVVTDISTNSDEAWKVAIQDDGKIVVAGTVTVNLQDDFAVVRYETDGDLDGTFNSSGTLPGVFTMDVSGDELDDRADGLAIHEGKIVVAGVVRGAVSNDFAVIRLDENGELDDTFNPSGSPAGVVVTDASGTDEDDDANAVVVQADGKIVVVGTLSYEASDSDDFIVARYEEDGDLDMTFNSTGIQITDFSGPDSFDSAFAVALQEDEKIVVAGFTSNLSDNDYAVARYETDGDLDSTFNSTGKVITDFTDEDDIAHAVAIQADGKIVAAGFFSDDDNSIDNFSMARYNPDGTLDTATFNNAGPFPGLAITDLFGLNLNDQAHAVAIQSDGKILLAGQTEVGGTPFFTPNFALARYLVSSAGQGNATDISIMKSASASSVMVGDGVTYTLTVTNHGALPAEGVTVTDVLTGSVSFGTISASQGTCSGTNELTCDLGPLDAGASATVTVPVTASGPGLISNIATVTAQTADPDPTNNLAFVFVNVAPVPEPPEPPPPAADLSLTKTAPSVSPRVGETVTYTMTVTNNGPDAATAVVVTEALFGIFGDLSAVATQGDCTGSGHLVCNLGTLDSGASATLTVSLTVRGVDSIGTLGTVVSQVADPELGNNQAAMNLEVSSESLDGGGGCSLNAAGGSKSGPKSAFLLLLGCMTLWILASAQRRTQPSRPMGRF